jgi:hypothetical protein
MFIELRLLLAKENAMGLVQRNVTHRLGLSEARNRLRELALGLSNEYPDQVHQVEIHWDDNQLSVYFAAYGFQYHWDAKVFSDRIELLGRYPESANVYRNKIEKTVVGKVEDILAEAVAMRKAA